MTLDLEDPLDKFLVRDKNPAKEEMGVVELKTELHQHDTSAVKSIQIDPDTDPIASILSFQKLTDEFGRVQIILNQLKVRADSYNQESQ